MSRHSKFVECSCVKDGGVIIDNHIDILVHCETCCILKPLHTFAAVAQFVYRCFVPGVAQWLSRLKLSVKSQIIAISITDLPNHLDTLCPLSDDSTTVQ